MHGGIVPNNNDIDELFKALSPNKSYNDKFILGIYNLDNNLIGVIDVVKDFPNDGQWILGLMLIKPSERGYGIGKLVHKELIKWAANL